MTIKTNEGIMNRTNISIISKEEIIIIEFDEEYIAGKAIATNSHFVEKFDVNDEKKYVAAFRNKQFKSSWIFGFFLPEFWQQKHWKSFSYLL